MRLHIIGNTNSLVMHASKIAKSHGASVVHCPTIEACLETILNGKGADLLLVDVEKDIALLIAKLKQQKIHLPIVAYGIDADSSSAVKAIKAGAQEYIPLPPDEKLIAAVLESIAEEQTNVIYKSEAFGNLLTMADRIAPSTANILITGESGTGKEVVARYIHNKSPRAKENFISVNCAAIPENLLESELFGHEKGAFTGATHRRIGKFEESNNGTLLLDEISEMDYRLQAKLLRAIQEKEIDRVGGTQPIKLNLRILATSNRNLKEEVKKGTFREDLLFRLNVIELKLPPLRERREDISLLAEFFVKKYSESNGLDYTPLSADAITKLESCAWQGNVRELENTIHRAVLLSTGDKIGVEAITISDEGTLSSGASSSNISYGINSAQNTDINTNNSSPSDTAPLIGRTVESVEKDLILGTINHCLGNKTKAANVLGISIRTLRNKINQYNEASGQ